MTLALSLIGNTNIVFSFIALVELVTHEMAVSDESAAATPLAVFIFHQI